MAARGGTGNVRRTLFALMMATASGSLAAPYDFFGRFVSKSDASKWIDVPLASGGVVPGELRDYVLQSVGFRLRTESYARIARADVRAVVVHPRFIDRGELRGISLDKTLAITAGKEEGPFLIDVGNVTTQENAVKWIFRLRSDLATRFLCSNELTLRTKSRLGADPPSSVRLKDNIEAALKRSTEECRTGPGGAKDIVMLSDVSAVPEGMRADVLKGAWIRSLVTQTKLVGKDGRRIDYSYCAQLPEEMKDQDPIDWEWMAKHSGYSDPDAGYERRRHAKIELSGALAEFLRGALAMDSISPVDKDTVDDHNLFVEDEIGFFIVKKPGAHLSLLAGKETIDDRTAVHKDRPIRVSGSPSLCSEAPAICNGLVYGRVFLQVDGKGKDGSVIAWASDPAKEGEGGDSWLLASKGLVDFLDGEVDLSVMYSLDARNKLVLLKRERLRVRNLGLVVTAPVVTDVYALAVKNGKGVSPNDLDLQSSIPISYAFGNGGKHVAITLPVTIGYNTENADNFANILRAMVHVSLVLPISDGKGPAEIAGGVGVLFLNAISMSWAHGFESGSDYWLLGFSAPDLKLLRA